MAPSELIARKVLFGNPEHTALKLSPNGKHISFLAPCDGVLNVWVAETNNPKAAKVITNDKKRGIRMYFWAHTNKHIIYLQDTDGDENWEVFCVDLEAGEIKNLTPFKGVHASIDAVSYHCPNEIIISHNKRRADFHDPYRVNIETGKQELMFENNEFASLSFDTHLRLRFGRKVTEDGGAQILEYRDDGSWKEFANLNSEDATVTGVVGFSKEDDAVYMFDCRERNTAGFYSINLKTGEKKLIAEDKQADPDDVLLHPTEKTVQGFAANYERKRWQFFDEKVKEDFNRLADVEKGDIEITSRNMVDTLWLVAFVLDNGPVQYYLYDRESKKAEYLFSNRPNLLGLPLVKMYPVIISSRDGLNLVSYLSLPLDADPDQTGKAQKTVPLILDVHGGPRARDEWGFDPGHQWLANRGYAVLSVNYRSSTGFGKKFIKAGNGEWAGKMHDDLIDAVNWAVAQGITTLDKVCIMGGSYGGYAALVGLTFTPDFFACGVDLVGPSNLETLMQSIPPYWKPAFNSLKVMIGGDPATDEGRAFLKSRSPLSLHEKIIKPLFIGQGANDPRVKQAEADQIVNAMQVKGIPVTYALYPDEGHGFARPENRMSYYALVEAFLSQILGGRQEPIGDDVKKSSVQILEGRSLIKGLD